MKKLRLFIIIGVLAFGVIVFNLLTSKSSRTGGLFQYLPTPTPIQTSKTTPTSSLRVISITPNDGEQNVPLNQTIQATFDKAVTNGSVVFSLYPEVPFTNSVQDKTMQITLSQPFDLNITYTYSFIDSEGNIIFTGSFTTGSASNSVAPLSGRYDNLDTVADKAQKESYPDVFLANYTPYETTSFSVVSDFSDSQGGHFFFTVSLKNSDGKTGFLAWLSSLGLTNQQIQALDIQYK